MPLQSIYMYDKNIIVHVKLLFPLNDDCRCGSTKIKMKFATYRSVGFNYRSRRPTFKPQKTEEATASAGAATQPQTAEKPHVHVCFHIRL